MRSTFRETRRNAIGRRTRIEISKNVSTSTTNPLWKTRKHASSHFVVSSVLRDSYDFFFFFFFLTRQPDFVERACRLLINSRIYIYLQRIGKLFDVERLLRAEPTPTTHSYASGNGDKVHRAIPARDRVCQPSSFPFGIFLLRSTSTRGARVL